MPGTCGICGERCVERTNNRGDYRGACKECKQEFDRPPRHVDQCSIHDCVVCESYYSER